MIKVEWTCPDPDCGFNNTEEFTELPMGHTCGKCGEKYECVTRLITVESDEQGCPSCGASPENLEDISGDYSTGVVAPDGGREVRHEQGYWCQKCGATTDDAELNRLSA